MINKNKNRNNIIIVQTLSIITFQYIRVGFPTDGSEEQKSSIVNTLCELLLNNWKMSQPNLIITVIGGTGFIQASSLQKKRIRHSFYSIIRIAMKTGKNNVTKYTE